MDFENDFDDFAENWEFAHETMAGGNKNFKRTSLVSLFELLEDYPIKVIKGAVKHHMKTAKFAPTPNDIIEIINESMGNKHLDVEEAWSIAQLLFDESNIVIATPEIFSAWCVASDTDKYSAAKAFKEKYANLVKTSLHPEWRTYGGQPVVRTGGYPLPARLANPDRVKELSKPLRIALDERLAITHTSCMTTDKLIDTAAKKSNVIDAGHRWADLKIRLKAPSEEKSRHELIADHARLAKQASIEACEKLKRENPDAFNRSSIEVQEDIEVTL